MRKTRQAFIVLLFLQLGWPALSPAQQKAAPLAQQGVLDLRNTNLWGGWIPLNGEWHFYWKQLISPGESPATPGSFTNFPSLWTKKTTDHEAFSADGWASYSLTVLLPAQRPELSLEVPDTYCAYTLFINGKKIAGNGRPGTTAATAIPWWSTQTMALNTGTDTLHLLLQVANFWHSKGGTYKNILLGDKQQLQLKQYRERAFDLILAGCLFMGGLFFFGLFLFGTKDRAILFFSLFCIVYSYRMVGTDLYTLHGLFPQLSWYIAIRLEYLSLVTAVALFSLYTLSLYPREALKLVLYGMTSICAGYAAMILFAPPSIFTLLLNPFLGLMFLYIIYAPTIYIQAFRHKRSGSVYALISSVMALVVFFTINLRYFNLIPEVKLLVFGSYIAFFFLQSLVLSHRFSETLRLAAVQARQGLKAKSEFLSTMSHEIRTPLNSVIGMSYLLKRGQPRDDQKQNLDVLLFAANNLLSIVNNILDYNKIEEGKISLEQISMDLPAIARNIVAGMKSLSDEKRIELRLYIDDRLNRKVLGDPTRTGQVISNLVHNAVKFTREGYVQLSVRVKEATADTITVIVSVEDTGIGIPADKRQLIFERFTQADSSTSRSFGGTGLGLSISRKILEMQGAAIVLTSEPGKGSVFSFTQTFKLTGEKTGDPVTGDTPVADESQLLKRVAVLLVEDNPMNVLVARTFLERCGATVEVAVNGQEAVDKYDGRFNMILMDLDMPVMDGYEATRLLRKKGARLPIIALTASLPKEVQSEVYAAGLTDIIVKPFVPDDLFRVILLHLQEG